VFWIVGAVTSPPSLAIALFDPHPHFGEFNSLWFTEC